MLPLALIGDAFDALKDFSDSPWFLAVVFGIALLDSVLPVVPSETLVIVGGVAAGRGDQFLPLVIAAGALGAFAGDNLAYQLGRSAEDWLRRTVFRSEAGAKRLEWATRQLEIRGGLLLVTARFIPGGRTAVTIASGVTRQRRRRFIAFDAVAATIWATYASLLGYIGGRTFENNHTLAFGVAFGLAVSITMLIELVRWLRGRRVDPRKPTKTSSRP
jgi:membrane protein DedA with SNARE-associated domain